MNKIRIWLQHPWLPVIVALLAMALTLPSLWNGLNLDDNLYRLVMRGDTHLTSPSSSPLNLYCIMDGNPVENRRLMNIGVISWWNPEKVKMFFFRPLSALTHWLDFLLWPDTPMLMHAQSLAWFGILVALVSFLYRRTMGTTWMAGLAVLFFAVDPAHNMAVAWLAGRNTLLAGVFGVLCLIIHDRWRRKEWRSSIILGPVCFALALLSAEAGIATGAYLLSHALFLEQGSLRNRITALIPYGLVLITWGLIYSLLGCGVVGHSHFYIDPTKESLLYLKALFHRAPVYLIGQWIFLPPLPLYLLWSSHIHRAGLVFAVFLALILTPLLRRDRIARFLTAGMILSLLPICAGLPDGRHLLFVGLGAMGLVAQLFALLNKVDFSLKSRLWRVATLILLVQFSLIHGVFATFRLPFSTRYASNLQKSVEQVSATLPSGTEFENRKFILVNTPAYLMYVTIVIFHRAVQGQLNPCRGLTNGYKHLTLSRIDSHTIKIRAKRGSLTNLEYLPIRDKKHPMNPGEIVKLNDMAVEVMEVYEGLPSAATFRFSVPLEDPSLIWFRWQDGGYVPFTPPNIGETITIKGARFKRGR